MRLVFDRLAPFFLAFAVLVPFLFVDRIDLMIMVNGFRTPFWDMFFVKSSALGHTISVVFALLLVLRFRFKWLAIFLLAFLIQVFMVVLLKKGIYHDELRPYLYFKYLDMLNLISLVDGVKMRHVNTFPSGHTATIFFLVSFFAILARNKVASWVLLMVGLLVGFSRIYLFQHWYVDVYFGMLFGAASSIIAYLYIRSNPKKWHARQLQIDYKIWIRHTQNAVRQLFNY